MELQHALTQIADIRRQMTLSRHFRGFRAASTLATALAAVGAGVWRSSRIPDPANNPLSFVSLWASVATASVLLCGGEVFRQYRNSESSSQQELALMAAEQFLPFILVGGMLTFVLCQYQAQAIWMLPGLWQILFGLGLFSLRRLAPNPIYLVGAFYVLCGLLNLSGGVPRFSEWSMAVPFAVGQTANAIILYWYLEHLMPRDSADPKTPGQFAYEGLERIIHEKARLSVLSSLAANPDGLVFTELKALCSLTDGNLSRQIQFLQSAGLVEVWKRFHNNRPQTLCRLTDAGRTRFLEYISELEKVIASAQQSKTTPSAAKRSRRESRALGNVIPSF